MGAEAGLSMLEWPAADNTAVFPSIHEPKDSFSLLSASTHRLTPKNVLCDYGLSSLTSLSSSIDCM